MHFDLTSIFAVLAAVFTAPAVQFVTAQKKKALAAAAHLEAQAASLKNPVERTLAETAISLAPVAIQAAAPTIESSVNHVVTEVTKANPSVGAAVSTLIAAALAPTPNPTPTPAPDTSSAAPTTTPAAS